MVGLYVTVGIILVGTAIGIFLWIKQNRGG